LIEAAGQTNSAGDHLSIPRAKYPIGAAFYELAEINRVRGNFTQAEESYRHAADYGQHPEPGLALLRHAQGRTSTATAAIRSAVEKRRSQPGEASLLAAYVEIMLADLDHAAAREGAEHLVVLSEKSPIPMLRALSGQSMGAVLLAEGNASAALAELRAAWMVWQQLEAPYESARVRVLLGLAHRARGDDEGAELELAAAYRVFHRLGATPDAKRTESLRRNQPERVGVPLTPRELQVIGLLATGQTNKAIAQSLSISERTVDRHVSNILTKLALPSRTAATAYAYQHGLI
jgi:DNA-binding NarL/FixJ family response regulator